jgi:hypothetical protein
VENRFQSLPFKCNLQRYSALAAAAALAKAGHGLWLSARVECAW